MPDYSNLLTRAAFMLGETSGLFGAPSSNAFRSPALIDAFNAGVESGRAIAAEPFLHGIAVWKQIRGATPDERSHTLHSVTAKYSNREFMQFMNGVHRQQAEDSNQLV